MSAQEILGPSNPSRYSKTFYVQPGDAVVISSYNFGCEKTNEIGEVVKPGDCAVLHKLDIKVESYMVEGDGCSACIGCVLGHVDVSVANSEPVVVCGKTWTHNADNNLSILTVPGVYMFELCDGSSLGSALIQVEQVNIEQAALLPRSLIHGE